MAGNGMARFNSREAALRFYFRVRELLIPNAKPGVFSTRRPPQVHPGPNIVHDLIALDSCFRGMSDVQLWLLQKLYGPGAFDTRPRPLAEIIEATKCQFPKTAWTLPRMAQLRREALKIFEAHLMGQHLISAEHRRVGRCPTEAREPRPQPRAM